jgi:hypothetical protein
MRANGPAVALLVVLIASACSTNEDAFVAHPRLQCLDGEKQFTPPANFDISQPGAPTAGDALRPILEAAAGPEQRIVQVSDDEFGLATDGRIILITRARQTRPGEWHFVDEFFCSDP